jgi:expansin (peptidoglycan-binding protein)
MEALTAPNANRNYDYERLEFYGDSVISFLVILELFLTKNYAYKEGPLDFYRIQQVSNMKFYKINIEHQFYKYMINEPQTIFNDFVPGAFENLPYQQRIKHKTLNELNNKIKELRKLEVYVKHLAKEGTKIGVKDQ